MRKGMRRIFGGSSEHKEFRPPSPPPTTLKQDDGVTTTEPCPEYPFECRCDDDFFFRRAPEQPRHKAGGGAVGELAEAMHGHVRRA